MTILPTTNFNQQFHRVALALQPAHYQLKSHSCTRRSKREAEAITFPPIVVIPLDCRVMYNKTKRHSKKVINKPNITFCQYNSTVCHCNNFTKVFFTKASRHSWVFFQLRKITRSSHKGLFEGRRRQSWTFVTSRSGSRWKNHSKRSHRVCYSFKSLMDSHMMQLDTTQHLHLPASVILQT